MKVTSKFLFFTTIFILVLNITQCKTQNVQEKQPFTVTEKSFFNWVGGQKGSQGMNINIAGTFNTRNLSFSKIYFQNREYNVVPEIKGKNFSLVGSYTTLIKKENDMYNSPIDEYGNEAPKIENKIPFDLQKDEAIIVYAISGEDKYYKVKGIIQLETVYYP